MLTPSSNFYTVSTVMFNKYGGANVAVKNYMSHFSMLAPTKVNVKLVNGNTGHAQAIGFILCHFSNCPIIYMVGTVYYFPGYPSNTISLGAIKCYVGFQKVTSEPLKHRGF